MSTGDSVWEWGMGLRGDVGLGHSSFWHRNKIWLFREYPQIPQILKYMGVGSCQTIKLSWLAKQQVQGWIPWKIWWKCIITWRCNSDFIWEAGAWPCEGWSADPFLFPRRRFSARKIWGWFSTMCSYPSGPSLCNTWTLWAGKCCKSHTDIYCLQWAADFSLLFQPLLSVLCLPRILDHKRVVSSLCCSNRQLKD